MAWHMRAFPGSWSTILAPNIQSIYLNQNFPQIQVLITNKLLPKSKSKRISCVPIPSYYYYIFFKSQIIY